MLSGSMPDPARCLTARPPRMSPAVHPTQRATVSFNSVWNVSPGEPDLSLTPSYCTVAFSAPIVPRTRLPCKHRPGHALCSSLAATLLRLLGSDPGAGSTHNPLCSCQNSPVARCVIVVQSHWRRAVLVNTAFGTESHHDAVLFL
ncbi:hypothetical protein HBI56_192270 [Parastagonospora nodorum]|uniref:Uncharacterized protein n=1 Tax=Phaeosphaeria nodorum (strain SN15 / ATCC MYA-4574 / FGSC 10173) TaxID=321614 RepID=A0A7U2IAI8_PHANO|nr:hypothetical protein HBH56_178060 [Parastagonospora nodorum]QRD06125.1 hypothetical protein JI435_445300 [Parastagonospora nodorum SN15]KAH3931777.1 hypothetical protein HBH54_091750 [Parastagonospora nodorum]KAH3939636.1 hypothetical protein HBH53_232670 [Parastagonospora nodorum]KAH3964289.1 hypothetical protein HBH52_211970 [Parastagonospora nodorum]